MNITQSNPSREVKRQLAAERSLNLHLLFIVGLSFLLAGLVAYALMLPTLDALANPIHFDCRLSVGC